MNEEQLGCVMSAINAVKDNGFPKKPGDKFRVWIRIEEGIPNGASLTIINPNNPYPTPEWMDYREFVEK